MQRSKAEGYIGLCMKAGKLTCGFNAVEVQKGRIYLLLLCGTASENAKKSARKLGERFGCGIMVLSGKTLEEVIAETGSALIAPDWCEPTFPLLIKLIDAADRLSVQVHPDDTYAADENYRIYAGGKI